MATYIVDSAAKKSDKPDKGYGPMQVISLALRGSDGEVKHAEWYTKAATAVPAPGSQIDGDVTAGQYGLSFKKASVGGGMGGPRPEDPQRAARILRQHSQDMALRVLDLADRWGLIKPEKRPSSSTELFVLVFNTADMFDQDAVAKGEKA